LKQREVVHDPFWAQAGVAEIYSFKMSYDMKACKLGLPPISLAGEKSVYIFVYVYRYTYVCIYVYTYICIFF
jgi:hypothetical protein